MAKYKSIKTTVDGIKFDSKAEAEYYIHLLNLQKIGDVKIIALQPRVYLTEARILYKPDFLIVENGKPVYIDVKGFITPVFAIKKRLWVQYGVGLLRLVKGFRTIDEVISKSS